MSEVEPEPKRQCVRGVSFLYGKASFSELRSRNGFYIDNTRYIRVLHDQRHHRAFLHRPPRFGKSLFLSTLEAYYDKSINEETRAMLFDGLDVLKDPVPGAGQYYILRWDFSVRTDITVEPSKAEDISDRLLATINYNIIKFAKQYGFQYYFASNSSAILGEKKNNLGMQILIDEKDALASFRELCGSMDMNNLPLFLLIDEYDRFANKLLFENPSVYQTVVVGESGKSGSSILRTIFETIKSAASSIKSTNELPFRVLTVGLSPMDLSDASGVNDGEDISHKLSLAGVIGFRREDLKFAMELLSSAGRVSEDETLPLLGIMEEYFDGYRFHEEQAERIYNPQLCLHLLKELWTGNISASKVISCPNKLLQTMMVKDDNVDLSENVFDFLALNPYSDSLIAQLKTPTPTLLQSTIRSKLKMKDLLSVGDQTPDFILSLMYYHGMVTLSPSPFPNAVKIPNKLAEIQYLDRLEKVIQPTVEKFIRTLQCSDLQVVIQSVLGLMGPMDDSFNEGNLKAILLGLFQPHVNRVLSLVSEPEVDGGKQRSDLLLVLNDGREAIIEFKTLMPHRLILPVMKDHLNTAQTYLTEKKKEQDWEPEVKRTYFFHLANESKDTTHFWNMYVKREVYTLFQTSFLNGTEEIQIKGVEEAEDQEYLENYPLKKRDNEKESFQTAGDYINSADKQVAQYGLAYFKERRLSDPSCSTPVLFVVSSFWTTHLVVKQVPFDPNSAAASPPKEVPTGALMCSCKPPLPAKKCISGPTAKHPNRAFWGCVKWPHSNCNFFQWAN